MSNLLVGEVGEDLLRRAKAPMNLVSLQLDEAGNVTETPDILLALALPYVFGYLFMLSIFFTSGYLLQCVSEEKENRIIEILLSSVSARQLLLGKIIGLGAAGLLQILVWLVSIRVASDVASVNIPLLADLAVPTSLLVLGILYFALGYLLFAVIFAGLGSIGSTARESQQMSILFSIPVAVPLVLFSVIAEQPDSLVARLLTLIPITAPVATMMRLPNASIPFWEIGASLVILCATIVVAVFLVGKIFRIYLLMYGKRPGIREVVRHVRGA